ncbi:pyruvate dehydrogenase [Ectocarpus siliculosus]|uniref:Pyruvate dehydrogenase n=1 Tax=Ectocarpus siliculosus TaxID=2880 RepID=D8LEK3_ECTSI|nr:pyruvate dehydrogenase [Ectocarpus siliculosus]|eukprot:CBN78566.1 pyruvate dehydrogenase [Ectocarpus siliculosus]
MFSVPAVSFQQRQSHRTAEQQASSALGLGAVNARRHAAAPTMRVERGAGGEVGPLKATVAPPATEQEQEVMRPPSEIKWAEVWDTLVKDFGVDESKFEGYSAISKEDQLKGYEMMQLCRQFENACNQAYMQGKIRGFMHLDNGQEGIPAMVADSLGNGDKKMSYYREHTHALASGVDAGRVMGELFAKDGGTCRGAGGSMHVYDKDTHFQGGWALVAEQIAYAAGAARSILMDRQLDPEGMKDDDRLTIVFLGEGAAQNGRMAETLNAAAKEKLPLLFLVIDNGRAINTFTPDVAANSDVFAQGKHYGVPGVNVDGQDMLQMLSTGRAVTDYVRKNGPAILQVQTYRFSGHSPADPEHERGRKQEKRWARATQDPLAIYESEALEFGITKEELDAAKKRAGVTVKAAVEFADASPPPPASLAKELEYPDLPSTDYNLKAPPANAEEVNARSLPPHSRAEAEAHCAMLEGKANKGQITIGDAINLAILEEMLRDPMTTIHAEDLQAGSSYDIPKKLQEVFGSLRAADEIIDEGHIIGKALGEGMNGYRPIVELMNTNFGIYGMAELSSAGNTYATTGGQFDMPMTIIGAGGTAPNQSLGAEHSQPFHAYVMGIPGLKICTAASPEAAYGITKSMIRDNGPGILFCPVKMMKGVKGELELGKCLPMNKAAVLHAASEDAVAKGTAVTVLTYLHGVKEAQDSIDAIVAGGADIDLIELRTLKPLDLETIGMSLRRTHKVAILDESTRSGGVGASISAIVSEELYDELDAPVRRLCMDDAPVPYASSMEKAVVKRGEDLIAAVLDLARNA